jgi:tRNA (guanine-N7-)-methyltransferase
MRTSDEDENEEEEEEASLLYPLTTILERLDLGKLFRKVQPLEVELGSGDGSFLVNYARLHAERNFIGVERLQGRIRKIDKKGRRAGLRNLRGIRIESAYFLEYLLPEQSAEALHIYFPDPWPKRKHWGHRLIKEGFPELAERALEADGAVFLRTDDGPYFQQMVEVFGGAKGFERIETPGELSACLTDFEEEFRAKGVETLQAAFRKVRR